jgi:hypothetical protein
MEVLFLFLFWSSRGDCCLLIQATEKIEKKKKKKKRREMNDVPSFYC